jgi:hypothetical protein
MGRYWLMWLFLNFTLEESWRSRPARWRYRSRKHRRAQQAHQFRAYQGPV